MIYVLLLHYLKDASILSSEHIRLRFTSLQVFYDVEDMLLLNIQFLSLVKFLKYIRLDLEF